MKNRRKLALILLFAGVLVVAGSVALYFLSDRQKFFGATDDINSVVSSLVGQDTIDATEKYCLHNDLKYSKGNISCVVEVSSTLTLATLNNTNFDKITSKAGWISNGSNLESWNTVDANYMLAHVYKSSSTIDCYILVDKITDKLVNLRVGCSGPARAAWYPVKD